ncbi:unnamed protein product [Nyctereutes procyonoides]|uniref:(raccoon dog) hypothetical protein n=1 Tax=Nyctereutes procyonoides TaxID=34880 RepID=A0A811YLS6_NYCPR|nr:unnamed protein product [Nyctereutes procyonoides]
MAPHIVGAQEFSEVILLTNLLTCENNNKTAGETVVIQSLHKYFMSPHCSVLSCEVDIVGPSHSVVRLELEFVKCLLCCHYLEIVTGNQSPHLKPQAFYQQKCFVTEFAFLTNSEVMFQIYLTSHRDSVPITGQGRQTFPDPQARLSP